MTRFLPIRLGPRSSPRHPSRTPSQLPRHTPCYDASPTTSDTVAAAVIVVDLIYRAANADNLDTVVADIRKGLGRYAHGDTQCAVDGRSVKS